VWCLAIKHDITPLGGLFEVEYDNNVSVTMLKKKIKIKKSNNHLTVWQCKESKLLADINANKLENIDLSNHREAV